MTDIMITDIVCRGFNTPFYGISPIWPSPRLSIFSKHPTFDNIFWQYHPNNIWGKQKYKLMKKVISSSYKTMLHSFFISNIFICHNSLRFDSKWWQPHVLKEKGFKRKRKHCKCKTCWINSIITTKSIHQRKAVLTPSSVL